MTAPHTRSPSCTMLLACAAFFGAGVGHGQPPIYEMDEVKAAFLYHFGTYVQWPQASPSDPVTIAVLGAAPVAEELTRFVPGRTIQGRPTEVRRLRDIDDLRDAEILFIGQDQNGRLPALLPALAGRQVLIVTDFPSGLAPGAMINFRLVERRVRFEISLPSAQAAGLQLSSRLLAAALRVETTGLWPDRLRDDMIEYATRSPGREYRLSGALLRWLAPRANA